MARATKIEVWQGKDRQWYIRLIASNGRISADAEGYTRKADAIRAAKRLPIIAAAARLVVSD